MGDQAGVGSSGAVSTQGVLTSGGENIIGVNMGRAFETAFETTDTLTAETLRVSIDGGETIDVAIALASFSDHLAALSYVETTINDALADAGQAGSVTIGTNVDGRVTITSNLAGSGSSVEILATSTATDTFSQTAGLSDYTKSAVAVDGVTPPPALDGGDLIINGVNIGGTRDSMDSASDETALSSDKRASGIAMAAAINAASAETGVTAVVNATKVDGGTQIATTPASTPQVGSIFVNGVETATITTNGANGGADDRSLAIDAINAIAGQTGVIAVDNGSGVELTAADGRNISVVINNNSKGAVDSNGSQAALTGAAIGLNVAEADISNGATYAATAETHFSSVTLNSAGAINVEAGANGAQALSDLGFRQGSYGSTESGVRVADIDISTVAGANAAIKALDNALGTVASERANLGAIQNRMESTVGNLAVTSENLSAANSRIRDADFAAESAELSRTQVLQQAGISILAQANQRPQQVLSLLG
jgi:flagellin